MRLKCVKIFFLVVFGLYSKYVQAGNYFKSDRLIFDFYSPQWVNAPNGISTDPSFSFLVHGEKTFHLKNQKFLGSMVSDMILQILTIILI
jgi:hypothetical protein